MKIHRLIILTLTLIFAGVSQAVQAQEYTTNLEAHVHGVSELTLVIADDTLEIQFTSPAFNLLGFEHKAAAIADIAAVETTQTTLLKHDSLFLMSESDCSHIKTSIDVSDLLAINSHEKSHHHSPAGHKHEQHQDDPQNDSHSVIVANYRYHCDNKLALAAITVALFEFFPGIHKIHAIWVTQTQQGALTLRPSNRIIQLR